MDVKPDQPLPLDIERREKQVVRILRSSSLDVTGENYSDVTLPSTRINGSITTSDRLTARSIASTDVHGHKTRIATYNLTLNTRNN